MGLKCGDFLIPLHQLLVELLDLFLGGVEIEEDSLVPSLKVTVSRVHVVELGFELESELHLLLVILRVLSIVFLQLETHLLLVHHFALELLAHLLLRVQVLLQQFLVIGLLFGLLLVLFIQFVHLILMLLRYLLD